MAIAETDIKLLWGRSGGRCANPACRKELTLELEKTGKLNMGEMAHVIARQPGGPRGIGKGGTNAYSNLVLLCPNCHTLIDKAPSDFPLELLYDWKSSSEAAVREIGKAETYNSLAELKLTVARLLIENKKLWADFGPHSPTATTDPSSNLALVWQLRKLDTILPNNARIVNMVENNAKLLTTQQYEIFVEFKNHATAFEKHQFHRLDQYPLFPKEFEKEFRA